MKETYKGYEVSLDKLSGKFDISLNGDELVTRDSWDAAAKYIDGQTAKDKKKFAPIEAILLGWGEWIRGKITSIAEDNTYRNGQQVWFISDKGARSKQAATNIAPITPEVLLDLKEIELLQQAIDSTQKRMEKIKDAIPRYKPEEGEK